ncbi:MAG: 3'-5' exonuclease, partial [Ornithinimicrobium sp.]|uniref:3'-5' exonuclease n=1 Tax=Ornithinimicrobium sp. TaxID=1977084 RepID=UPI0026E09B46
GRPAAGPPPRGDRGGGGGAGAGGAPASTAPASAGAARERWESLQALALLADDLARTAPEARVKDLVTELDRRAAEQHAPTVQGITLASLHAAKGLEWDAVFLVGCSEGLLPITLADTPERVEEERRLLYVGITRARERLALSWSLARSPGGRSHRSVSRFLAPAAGVLGAEAASAPRRQRRSPGKKGSASSRPRTCRACGTILSTAAERKIGRCEHCPPTYDEAVFESLKQWRLRTAQEAGMPAFVIFTDATLTAVAEAMPTDESGLRAISGVGDRKLEMYGEAVLDVLRSASSSSG